MPRFSRISWKRRDDAEPPRIESSSDAAKRRRSEREMPVAPRQTWYCSVSLRWKRSSGAGRLRERPAHAGAGARRGAGAALAPLEKRDEAVVLEVPRRRDDDVPAARTSLRWYAGERAAADRGDDLCGADHGPAERVIPEHRLREEIVDELLRRVLVHRDLLEHDLALLVDLRERGREDHVGHDLERRLDMAIGDAGEDDGVLARRRGVELGAHRVERLGDRLRVEAARALEEEVLDEVRDARTVVALVARADIDPEPERDGTHARSRAPR